MSRTRRGGESSPLLAPWMCGCRDRERRENSPLLAPQISRSREEEGRTPSSRRGCRDREGRGEYSPPRAVDVLKTPSVTSRREKRGGRRACGSRWRGGGVELGVTVNPRDARQPMSRARVLQGFEIATPCPCP